MYNTFSTFHKSRKLFPTKLVERNIFLFSTTLLHLKINKELKAGFITVKEQLTRKMTRKLSTVEVVLVLQITPCPLTNMNRVSKDNL